MYYVSSWDKSDKPETVVIGHREEEIADWTEMLECLGKLCHFCWWICDHHFVVEKAFVYFITNLECKVKIITRLIITLLLHYYKIITRTLFKSKASAVSYTVHSECSLDL